MDSYPPAVRVLVRPPPAPPLATAPPRAPTPTPTPPDPSPTTKNGIVVVGFIGTRSDDVAQLINKIIDSNVFGSGNLDTPFRFQEPELVDWFESRKLSYYHDEDKGILYLQFSSPCCGVNAFGSDGPGFEDQELGDLQGLLFMFSVCHVLILIQEGSRFDTQTLKKFRVLQAAKNAISMFVRSKNMPPITSRSSSASSRIPTSGASTKNPSPGKSRGRNGSTITLMSGLGSYTSLLPGQCTPVILFVFLDDFTEMHPGGNVEEPSENSMNSSPSLNSSTRLGLPTKGSGSVVVLTRPANKSEGGLRKKLQSSLEAQIRFSIKKCRTLSGPESSHAGLRSGNIAISAPLFSLDASKAVSLIDVSSCQSGESLEFAIHLVEEVLEGKETSDSLLLESPRQNAKKEEIICLKEFIYRQSETLRGRSGSVATANSSSAAGVGMVAVAAAAAAASASSGKTVITPDLPSLETWSTSCRLILHGILSAKLAHASETQISRMDAPPKENIISSDSLLSAVSHLENSIGLSNRFSTLWCQKAFPVAKEVYLDGLPPCYPSSLHEGHLKKALLVLTSMVKGPAVKMYLEKLKDECTSIWSSGRQQCDAVSLTGKPCIHQRHDIENRSADEIKPHSSGFVYLHACACGRSRRLQPDPFDYETANVAYSIFADCDKLLPAVQFPVGTNKGPIQPSSWSLMRIGGASYYDPSKGLLQSGFCATKRFLLRWTIFEKLKEENHPLLSSSEQIFVHGNTSLDNVVEANTKTSLPVQVSSGKTRNGVASQVRPSFDVIQTSTKTITFGGGLSNFAMRKPFSEVVAGTAAANSGFPPLFSGKQHLQDSAKGVKVHHSRHQGLEKSGEIVYNQESFKDEKITSIDKTSTENEIAGDICKYAKPVLHVGSNIIPLDMTSEIVKAADAMKRVTIYVGFEHECPHGHRFILNMDHLDELGSSYAVPEENFAPLPVKNLDKKQGPRFGKFGRQGRTEMQSNVMNAGGFSSKTKSMEKLNEKVANGSTYSNKSMHSSKQHNHQNGSSNVSLLVKDLDSGLKPTSIDNGDCLLSLNRSLPIYMNCPHCRDSKAKNDKSNIKFASTISQLQRIILVTPSYPILLAANPVIQFEVSCLPPSVPDREQKLQFSLGCPVVLPPDSSLSLRLPFVYGVELDDGSLHSLKPFENQPELTAWILKGTSLQVVSQKSNLDLGLGT